VLVGLIIIAACGTGGGGGQPADTPESKPEGCGSAPAVALAAISTGLLGGTHLGTAAIISDPERSNVSLIAAVIEGPGIEGSDSIGVWATNNPSDPGTIYSVDAFATEFSEWPLMPDASVSEWQLARRCL